MLRIVTPKRAVWAPVLLMAGALLAGLLVLFAAAKPAEAVLSAANGKIAFQSDRSGDYTDDPNWPEAIFDVWIVTADGSR
jgi:hypothetical protein